MTLVRRSHVGSLKRKRTEKLAGFFAQGDGERERGENGRLARFFFFFFSRPRANAPRAQTQKEIIPT